MIFAVRVLTKGPLMAYDRIPARDHRISSMSNEFPGNEKLVKRIIKTLETIYRQKAIDSMSRFSRGSVLIQDGKVVTSEMIEDHIASR